MLQVIISYAPIVGLLFFVSVFTVILVKTYRPKSKQKIESYKNIPLVEE